MKELLLADANRLSASHSEYEATRQQIDSAADKTFTLREADANNDPHATRLYPKAARLTGQQADTS